MANDVLAYWSSITVVVRFIAIVIFAYIAHVQLVDIKRGDIIPKLSYLLLALFIVAILCNLPVLYLNYIRSGGKSGGPGLTAFATITNAAGWFVTGVIFLLFKRYKGQ